MANKTIPIKPAATAATVTTAATVITGPAGAPAATVISGPKPRPRAASAVPRNAADGERAGGAGREGQGGREGRETRERESREARLAEAAARYFRNYTQMPAQGPAWVWVALRGVTLGVTLALAAILIAEPGLGLLLFWGLAIPVVPALLVVAPGLWRQVCPMAALNQLPRALNKGRALDLPAGLKNAAFAIALAIFIGAVALRQPWLNRHGPTVGVLVLAMLVAALAGGWFFKGRSGWCGTFCPLGPIQRTYGQAPLVVVRNGYCEPCVGCQKNCYDFNPRAAVFSDVYDDDARYASQRRLFMGLLPGLLLGYFLAQPLGLQHPAAGLALLLGAAATSAGVYGLALAFVPANPYRVSLAFGAAAITIFYFFAGPVIVSSVGRLAGVALPEWLSLATRGVGLVLAVALGAAGLRAERRYARVAAASKAAKAQPMAQPAAEAGEAKARFGGGRSLKDRLARVDAAEVTDRETGITFQAASDGTLLEAIEKAGLKINYGCRAGVCGADAIAICDGAEHLSPMNADERATLRRMGLDGSVRLACMCVVAGPVTIDRDARSAAPRADPATVAAKARVDRARGTDLKRVVIVGNGVAGMSVAEGVRRNSPTVHITIVANEPHRFYNRMGIGRLVYDPEGMDALHLVPTDWAQSNGIQAMHGRIAARIDREQKRLGLTGGDWLPYDRLVLTTGARASVPDATFMEHPNAFVLRAAEDAESIREYVRSSRARRAVVVGGGVLGVEAADALHKLGLKVALLHRADRLMNAQLDERGAGVLASYLESIGVQVVTGVQVTRYDGTPEIGAAWLAHGPRVRADLFVACLGIQPNVHLAETAGLDVGSGIRVDAGMRTSDPNILAAGDCAEMAGSARGLWPIGAAQAAVVVESIFGEVGVMPPSRQIVQLKCDGIDVRSFGTVTAAAGDETLQAASGADACWRFIVRDGELVGGLTVGPPGSAKPFMRIVQDPVLFAKARPALARGELPVMAAELA
ncbi:MAG: FAD-dependent oxidoreductase [Burkholderiales bacterium]|nr:FAD-dependent oxidoreductase [Burkholderiales bacterium]